MPGEPAEPPPSSEDPDPMVLRLQRQMARLKRWFEWERWRLEPRSFDPPDDLPPDDLPPDKPSH
jgi:hypothetical protein